jgi:hypothetical protein
MCKTAAIPLVIRVDQQTLIGPVTSFPSTLVDVLPGKDLIIIDDGLASGWMVEKETEAIWRFDETDVVHTGDSASRIEDQPQSLQGWQLQLDTDPQISTIGLRALTFVFHPGELSDPDLLRPSLRVIVLGRGETSIDLYSSVLLDYRARRWQTVTIPIDLIGPITGVLFVGNQSGVFYIDDLRLVSVLSPLTATAVTEDQTATPDDFELSQNPPNPFNSSTNISFDLAESAHVELAVHNLAGQRVATLVYGLRDAGTHRLHWDGRDSGGRTLASGLYLYRLTAGDRSRTRKLMLLR